VNPYGDDAATVNSATLLIKQKKDIKKRDYLFQLKKMKPQDLNSLNHLRQNTVADIKPNELTADC